MIPIGVMASAHHGAGSGRTVTYVPFQHSGTSSATHTWTVDTGAAGDGRSLLLGISADRQAVRYVTGATVDGNAATLDAVASSSWHCIAMGRYALPSGSTSVTVTATFSANDIIAGLCAWVVTGGALTLVGSSASFLAQPGSRTVAASPGGLAFYVCMTPDSQAALTWSGLGLDQQTLTVEPRRRHALHGLCDGASLTVAPSASTPVHGSLVTYS